MVNSCIKVGPWGVEGGVEWSYRPEGGITEIVIFFHGSFIDSISFKSDEGNGCEHCQKFGGDGGTPIQVSIAWPREYLTSISGTCFTTKETGDVLNSFRFKTNITEYGPFGTETGYYFSLQMEDGIIVGFHGRAGDYIYALGAYVEPLTLTAFPINSVQDLPRDAGPWGGDGGETWDDGVFSDIHKIIVFVCDASISGIRILYARSSMKSFLSEKHGGCSGDICRIKLAASSEYLVGISGFFGRTERSDRYEVLRSITFYTNKAKYGPFGDEIGEAFSSATCNGKIVGFHGRSGNFLHAIGVHKEYF
ncbi:hypothetical protein SLE2022_311950 [Rubroshorea leprosula]